MEAHLDVLERNVLFQKHQENSLNKWAKLVLSQDSIVKGIEIGIPIPNIVSVALLFDEPLP